MNDANSLGSHGHGMRREQEKLIKRDQVGKVNVAKTLWNYGVLVDGCNWISMYGL